MIEYKLETPDFITLEDNTVRISNSPGITSTSSFDIGITESFGIKNLLIKDNRNNVKGKILIKVTSTVDYKGYKYIPVKVTFDGKEISKVEGFDDYIRNSFYQAEVKWSARTEKELDVDALWEQIPMKYQIALNESIYDVNDYRTIMKSLYQHEHGVPGANDIICIFSNKPCKNTDGEDVSGFQDGNYIFYFSTARPTTYPHELGHWFDLKHTWTELDEPEEESPPSKKKTSNIMDYSSVRHEFWYWQWLELQKKDSE